mmetsp:Transcript_8660/g.7852  ORF Transcript_8660/g.7852 Transcript_8660/m.7852 type:complete len:96 (-) Transcript_8660:299-586(-)
MVISPTRELAMQIYDVCKRLVDSTKLSQTYGIVMGGVNRKNEADKLSRGINIIVATPGRPLPLQRTPGPTPKLSRSPRHHQLPCSVQISAFSTTT